MNGLTEGRIVHFVLPDGKHRPAIVVHVWRIATPEGLVAQENGICQLQVFTDSDPEGKFNDALPQVMWKTSVVYDVGGKPGTWHWIERA